jgi:hypothetical protein
VLAWVISRVRKDLDEYLAWEAGRGDVIDVVPAPVPAPSNAALGDGREAGNTAGAGCGCEVCGVGR